MTDAERTFLEEIAQGRPFDVTEWELLRPAVIAALKDIERLRLTMTLCQHGLEDALDHD